MQFDLYANQTVYAIIVYNTNQLLTHKLSIEITE